MLEFQQIHLQDREKILPYIRNYGYCSAEYCFGNLFIWQDTFHTEYAISRDVLFIRGIYRGKHYYQMPLGGDGFREAMEELICEDPSGISFFGLNDCCRKKLEKYFPGRFLFSLHEDKSDYIYNRSDLSDLPGKKYHAKRNYLNRFAREHGESCSEPITPENLAEVIAFQERWLEENKDHREEDLKAENKAVALCLQNFKELEMFGRLLRVDGEVAAYAVGEQLGCKMVVEHFEKATRAIDGCYTVMLSQFAKGLPEDVLFINREEDMGLPGLRKAKQSLHPCRMENKYVGEWNPHHA